MNNVSNNEGGIQKLTSTNYGVWSIGMQGILMSLGGWGIITGEWKQPTYVNPTQPTPEEKKELREWRIMRQKCAGAILCNISDDQYVHIEEKELLPEVMWVALHDAHQSGGANARFRALQTMANIRKSPTETLSDYLARISQAGINLKALIPSKINSGTASEREFTALDMVDELIVLFALTHIDDPRSAELVSSLLGRRNFDLKMVFEAFRREDSVRRGEEIMQVAWLHVTDR